MAVIAEHPGICPECDDYIQVGDPIVTTADLAWAHERCEPSPIDRIDPRTICPICWLEKPCECDDRDE